MLLEVERLDVAYDKVQILWDVSLNIDSSEIVIIVGPNGAGKSTLLKAITGIVAPHKGSIRFKGHDLVGLPTHEVVGKGVSLIPAGAQIFPGMTVSDNLYLGNYQDRKRDEREDTLEWIYGLFPVLREKKSQIAGTLSGGQRQMLALGIGLMSRPDILLIDEPSSGLAPKLVSQLMGIIRQIRKSGLTVMLVEQNVHAALTVADRGYVLENGRITFQGDKQALSSDEHVREAYLGH